MTPLHAALASQAGGGAGARWADPQLVARSDFAFGVIVRPVGEGGRGPEVAFCPSSPAFSIGFHRRRLQVGVVNITLCAVGNILAGLSRGAGCRLHEGVLAQKKPTRIRNRIRPQRRQSNKEMRLTTGGGLSREYGSLPNYQSSSNSQCAIWFTKFATSLQGISLVLI